MLDPVKSSPAGARFGATRTSSAVATTGSVQVPAANGDEGVHNDDRRRPSYERGKDREGERKAAIDHAIESLLKDAAAVPPESETVARPKNAPDEPPAPVEKHVVVAGLYARHERSDNRDTVLRPGAVFSASF